MKAKAAALMTTIEAKRPRVTTIKVRAKRLQKGVRGEGMEFHAQNVKSHSPDGNVLFGIITFVCLVFPPFATSSHIVTDVKPLKRVTSHLVVSEHAV